MPTDRAAEITAAEASGILLTRNYVTELLLVAHQRRVRVAWNKGEK